MEELIKGIWTQIQGDHIEQWILDQIELAAQKKDRNVSITICPDGTKTISVYPMIEYQEDDE